MPTGGGGVSACREEKSPELDVTERTELTLVERRSVGSSASKTQCGQWGSRTPGAEHNVRHLDTSHGIEGRHEETGLQT